MPNIKKYFVIASIAVGTQAIAAPAVEISESKQHTAAQVKAAPAQSDNGKATVQAAARPADAVLTSQPAHWSMLLVGAGVLLLPRKRRVDNSVR